MFRRAAPFVCLLIVWLTSLPVRAATVTIDFDVDPGGAPIGDATPVNTVYSSLGVTFERSEGPAPEVRCNDGDIFARSQGSFASSPNVVSICETGFPSFTSQQAYIRGTLARDAVEICIAVDADGSIDKGTLEIVDDMDNVLASADSSPGATETICVQGEAIQYFRFAGDGLFALFDDLRITYGPNRIDFDTTADGLGIADGAVVNDLFESEGVVFEYSGSGTNCGGEVVYANDDLPGGFGSAPNAVSVCNGNFSDFSETEHGRVRARFVRPISQVCVNVLPSTGSGRGVLRGFDGDDVEVATAFSEMGVASQVCVSNPAIRYVEFGGHQSNLARFDDLDFELGNAAIDFDFDPADAPVADGSIVNTTYASLGVTFTGMRVGGACGVGDEVYANADPAGDFASSPNQVSLCGTGFSDFSQGGDGMIAASFPVDALSVCVDVRASRANDFAVLQSFDASVVMLDQVESSQGATETLCIAGTGIRSVRFAGAGSGFARFDDLDVTFAPEPGSGVLALAGLLGVAGLARHRRRRSQEWAEGSSS